MAGSADGVSMRVTKNGSELSSQADWFRLAPPKGGERQWKAGRSALEVARAWFPEDGSPVVPPELDELLGSHPDLAGLRLIEAEPEVPIPFDNFRGEPRNADLVIRAKLAAEPVAITVEAKADESFDRRIESLLVDAARTLARDTRTNAIERAKGLADALLPPWREGLPHFGELRYQLITGVAGTLALADQMEARKAILIVHELIDLNRTKESRRRNNREDLDRFVRRLSGGSVERLTRGQLAGPLVLPGGGRMASGVALYVGKARRDLP